MVKKNYDDMLSRFHTTPERNGRTDGQTDRRKDKFAISVCWRAIKSEQPTIEFPPVVGIVMSRFLCQVHHDHDIVHALIAVVVIRPDHCEILWFMTAMCG